MNKDLRLALTAGLLCFSALIMILSSGCNPMPNGGVPIYLRIDSPTVVIDDSRFGSASFKIPDVWAETGNHNLGAYEMPVSIPVLASGDVPMLISGGIFDNGIFGTRVSYPFYRPDTFTISNAIPGHVYHHKPVYHYLDATLVGLNADFEYSNPFDSKMTNISSANIAYEGARCGGIIMSPADTLVSSIQTLPMTIQTNGREAYIELNYKNPGIYFDVFLRAKHYDNLNSLISSTDYPKTTFKPSVSWNKTYLNFNNEAGVHQGDDFQIIFVAYRLAGTTDTLLVDNVKFLYFH